MKSFHFILHALLGILFGIANMVLWPALLLAAAAYLFGKDYNLFLTVAYYDGIAWGILLVLLSLNFFFIWRSVDEL